MTREQKVDRINFCLDMAAKYENALKSMHYPENLGANVEDAERRQIMRDGYLSCKGWALSFRLEADRLFDEVLEQDASRRFMRIMVSVCLFLVAVSAAILVGVAG